MSESLQLIKERLSDKWWRLNNLYKVVNEKGEVVTFRLNWAQEQLYRNMWYLNLILKARQLGMTTFIQIYMLDACLFGRNISAGVIAHNREDAEDFFDKKIGFAYENLPPWLKDRIPTVGDNAKQLEFSNGSRIRVGTSLRSGTYQYLHISEFGKICAKFPDKAQEIITGSLNTVHAGQHIFIESTAEGAHGEFYDMCQDAKGRTDLTELDYKLFFFPWYEHPSYRIDPVPIGREDEEYFRSLEEKGISLDAGQKSWYVKKKQTQRGLMKQEYPSLPEEAFTRISEHSVYGVEMKQAREDGRIGNYPYDPSAPVYTFWDLGRSKTDNTSIWFMQPIGGRYRFIKYISDVQKPVNHYAKLLQGLGYVYKLHHLPHDGGHNDFTMQTFEKHLHNLGITNTHIVPRIASLNEGIQMTRDKLSQCEFDEEGCADGIQCLEAYRYIYDEKLGMYRDVLHDWASHGADAFRQFAQGYRRSDGLGMMSPSNNNLRRGHQVRSSTSWMV